jgi:hypothetical protein
MNTNNEFYKYLNNKTYKNGEIITNYVNELINYNNYNNIMFIRTPTTGAWLDDILPNNNNIIRLCYYIENIQPNNCKCHKLTTIINLYNLEQTIKQLNNKYDLIVIDPYHEYNVSYNNFNLLLLFLNHDGCIISHDCYPSELKLSIPVFKKGPWCGQTYLAFIQLAYNNPHLFYAILNIDTGIGIINKRENGCLRNNLDKYKQEYILSLDFINDYDKAYNYFINNSFDIINGISL